MTVSKIQLQANRQNALRSTGPRSDQGKETASQNATRHGLYAKRIIINSPHLKEDATEYDLLYASLIEELKPTSLFQEYLVRKIANCLWRCVPLTTGQGNIIPDRVVRGTSRPDQKQEKKE